MLPGRLDSAQVAPGERHSRRIARRAQSACDDGSSEIPRESSLGLAPNDNSTARNGSIPDQLAILPYYAAQPNRERLRIRWTRAFSGPIAALDRPPPGNDPRGRVDPDTCREPTWRRRRRVLDCEALSLSRPLAAAPPPDRAPPDQTHAVPANPAGTARLPEPRLGEPRLGVTVGRGLPSALQPPGR